MQFLAWRVRAILPLLLKWRRRPPFRGRVLCVLAGGLGDKLMALPAIRQFRSEFSGQTFVLLVLGILPPFWDGEADEVIQLKPSDTFGLYRCARRKFDACFINSIGVFDVRLEVAAWLTGSLDLRGPRFSFLTPRQVIYSRSYEFGNGHETIVNFAGVGGATPGSPIAYPLNLPTDSLDETEIPDVIFHPGSSAAGLINRWPMESYAQVGETLQKKGLSVWAVGTHSELPLLNRLAECSHGAVQPRTNLSLKDLARVLNRTRLVIANDSGIGHLAASADATLITLMGPTRPEKIGPVGEHVQIIGPRCEFGGCYNNADVPVCQRCIERITPAEVLQAANVILNS